MFTEDGELTASAAPACGNSDWNNLSLGVDIHGVYVPALVAPGSCPILFRCGAHGPLNRDIFALIINPRNFSLYNQPRLNFRAQLRGHAPLLRSKQERGRGPGETPRRIVMPSAARPGTVARSSCASGYHARRGIAVGNFECPERLADESIWIGREHE